MYFCMATPFSAAIVDDRLRVLELVKANLQKIKNCSILFTHTNPYHFFEHLNPPPRYLPDIVIIDCQMLEIDSMTLSRLMKLFFPSIQINVSGFLFESDVVELMTFVPLP